MSKWEKKIVDYLAKAESDALEGIAAGFETGSQIPTEMAVQEIVHDEENMETQMGEDLDKSQDIFPSDNEGDIQFTVNIDLFNIQSDTELSLVQREENIQH